MSVRAEALTDRNRRRGTAAPDERAPGARGEDGDQGREFRAPRTAKDVAERTPGPVQPAGAVNGRTALVRVDRDRKAQPTSNSAAPPAWRGQCSTSMGGKGRCRSPARQAAHPSAVATRGFRVHTERRPPIPPRQGK
ncbi:hypothetical protein GCM10009800_21260 [Nocardiopsis rhodophaea]